jgi:hypothetical protein
MVCGVCVASALAEEAAATGRRIKARKKIAKRKGTKTSLAARLSQSFQP